MASSSKDNVTSEIQENGSDDKSNGNSEEREFLPGYKSLQDYTKSGYRSLMEMTKTSNNLPNEEHWAYFSSFPSFQDVMTSQGSQVIKLLSTVLKSQGIRGNMARRDVEERFDLLLDANDTLLERVALNLDEVAGIRKNPVPSEEGSRRVSKPLSGSWNQQASPSSSQASTNVSRSVAAVALHSRMQIPKVITRPQLQFEDKIDNSVRPFEPRIKHKPNAKKPLAVLIEYTEDGEVYSHPYDYELDLFEPPDEQLKPVTPKPARSLEDTPLKYVDCADSLKHMVDDLRNYHELAVDLEHHSYRSFQGFTCLMQISTRHTDYIVDTLKLRSKLHVLNELFTNPAVIKVFHGCDSDVEWLQKDLSLYLVNVFDTHQAGKLLNIPRLSLAFLVKYYCDIELDKTFQLADWRLRPLLPEMIEYARADTHYLLYVYDRMKNALIEAGLESERLLRAAITQSTQICKKIYVKPPYDEDGYLKLYQKSKKMFNNRQKYAMKELHMWRDLIARAEDESTGYVLPNHMLLQISESLPREMQGILACCNPIPPLMRQNLSHLHSIILRAREQPLVQMASVEQTVPQTQWTKINIESSLHCPHQLPPQEDQRDDLPTLLGPRKRSDVTMMTLDILSESPCINVLGATNVVKCEMQKKVLSPYQRYMLVKPYMMHLAKQAELQQATETKPSVPSSESDQRMEKIKLHFMALDSRTAAAETPPSPPSSPEVEQPVEIKEEETKQESESESEEEEEEEESSEPAHKRLRLCDQNEGKLKPMREKRMSNNQKKKLKWKEARGHNPDHNNTYPPRQKYPSADAPSGMHSRANHCNAAQQRDDEVEVEAMSSIAEPSFDYNSVDYSRFQGGSRQGQHNPNKKHNNKNKGKFGKGRGKKFNFPQRQNQKSFTYKN